MVGKDWGRVSLARLSTWDLAPKWRNDWGAEFLDLFAKQHDIDYAKEKTYRVSEKRIKGIDNLLERKTMTERIVKRIM